LTRPSAPRGGSWPPSGEGRGRFPSSDHSWSAAHDDDGWGPPTAVYSSAAAQDSAAPPNTRVGRAFHPNAPPRPQHATDSWAAEGPLSAREQRAVRAADRRAERSVAALETQEHERGLPWWAALLVLIALACLGGLIDTLGSIDVKRGFNIGIVVASIVAILAVKRSHMFPVVIAPPIVYSVAALFQFYIRRSTASSGASRRQIFYDTAANYLVYGFPAIATASAAVLIIAGVRLIARK
jgi:hypothetical protein